MREPMKYLGAAALLLLFLPFLLTALLSGRKAVAIEQSPETEKLLPMILYREAPEEAPEEFLRAQAILARSRILLGDQKKVSEVLQENLEFQRSHRIYPGFLEQCRQAAADTEGLVLTYEDKLVEGPYFAWGSGKTRDGKEVMGSDAYSWIVSVDSSMDVQKEDYQQEIKVSRETFRNQLSACLEETEEKEDDFSGITVISRDSAGYVTEIAAGELHLSGEKLRSLFSLPSSCFTVEETGEQILFLCQGKGHGLGMSQYGAAVLAKEGKTAEEILKYYFPEASVDQYQA